MTRTRMLFVVGILIAALPYLGFPYLWKNILIALAGLGVSLIAYLMHRESRKEKEPEKPTFENFSENSSFGEAETKI